MKICKKKINKMIWKDLKGFEGIYKISENGDIKSLERMDYRKLKQGLTKIRLKQRILKPTTNGRYKLIHLLDGNMYSIHRLVYKSFIGEIKEDMVIHHIDENRYNNHYSNLLQITQKENAQDYSFKRNIFTNSKNCKKCNIEKDLDEFYLRAKKDLKKYK
jgi:hypothetical protein